MYARSSTAEWLAFNQFDGGSNPPGRTNGFSLPSTGSSGTAGSPKPKQQGSIPCPGANR